MAIDSRNRLPHRSMGEVAPPPIAGGEPDSAAMFVYVSNAEDGDIGTYRMLDSGELQPGGRAGAASLVMPMTVSPDRRFLYAASRSTPYTVHVYAIDPGTGALKPLGASPLADSFAYISLDATGRFRSEQFQ